MKIKDILRRIFFPQRCSLCRRRIGRGKTWSDCVVINQVIDIAHQIDNKDFCYTCFHVINSKRK